MLTIKEYINENTSTRKYVDIMLLDQDMKLLVVRRANYMKRFRGLWGMPGGSIDNKKDVDSQHAASRELREETSISLTGEEITKMKRLTTLSHHDGSTTTIWQAQIEHERNIKLSGEHSKYEWIALNSEEINKKRWIPQIKEFLLDYIKDNHIVTEMHDNGRLLLFQLLDKTNDYNYMLTEKEDIIKNLYNLKSLVLHRASRYDDSYIKLGKIVVESRNHGDGTKFMTALCEWADKNKKTLILSPDTAFGASSRQRLVKFYHRFGFVENKGKHIDFCHNEMMHRKPQKIIEC